MTLAFDPEIQTSLAKALAAYGTPPVFGRDDFEGLRVFINAQIAVIFGDFPPHPEVTRTDTRLPVRDGEILLRWFVPAGIGDAKPGPAALYTHGGGMICGSLEVYDRLIGHYAQLSGVPLLAIDYRLPPEHPHPTPVEDCFAGLVWLHEHAVGLGVDPARIGVIGDSAGGGLAAGVAVLARDRGVSLKRQILIYPMLDDRTLEPNPEVAPFAAWTYENNFVGWNALLGEGFQKRQTPPAAAPARLENFAGLAPAYIDVGELDIFCGESIEYAKRLNAANISVELHVHPGAPHGYEMIKPMAAVGRRGWEDRVRALQSL